MCTYLNNADTFPECCLETCGECEKSGTIDPLQISVPWCTYVTTHLNRRQSGLSQLKYEKRHDDDNDDDDDDDDDDKFLKILFSIFGTNA